MSVITLGPTASAGLSTGADRGQAYAHLFATSGTGTEASPYVHTDGTAGIGAALASLTRGGQITLGALRFEMTSPVTIATSGLCIYGISPGGNVDPNGESEGISGTKIRSTGTPFVIPQPSGARLSGINFEHLYFWGPGKGGYNSTAAISVTSANLDQPHFTDINVGNHGAAIQVAPGFNGQLDTPYFTRINALHCSFGLLISGGGSIYGRITDCCFSDLDVQGVSLNNSGGYNHFASLILVRCGGADGSAAYPNSAVTFASPGNELVNSRIENTGFRQLTGTAGSGGTRSNYADAVQLDGNYNVVKGGTIVQTTNGSGVHIRNNAAGCRVENVHFESNLKDITIDSGCTDTVISCPGQVLNITDNGTRTIINGVSNNAGDPNTTGAWNGFAKPAGLFIRDTINSITYLYLPGGGRSTLAA